MTITHHTEFDQGSIQWRQARKGVITASNVKHILTPTLKVAANDKTRSYVYQLVADRVTDFLEEGFESWDMRRGKQDEIYARELYSETYEDVQQCAFISNTIEGVDCGYSPDGLVGDDGLIEVKSRKTNLSIKDTMEFLHKGEVPKDDILQVQFGLLVSEREWCDYIIYSGGIKMVKVRSVPIPLIQDAMIEAIKITEEKVVETMARYLEFSRDFPATEYRPFEDGEIIT